jgi:hypothetical protein
MDKSTLPSSSKNNKPLTDNFGMDLFVKDKKVESIQDNSKHANVLGSYSPEILPLGYSPKRKEQRLIYVMPISMIYKGKLYHVKSKDFSVNGIKVFLPRTLFISGERVKLDFDQFIEKENGLTDNSAKSFFQGVQYRIVDVQHINNKTYLSLIQIDLKDYSKQIFSQFINGNRIQYKLDVIDILLAAKAQYIEHVYTHNINSIPLFLSYDQKNYYIKNIIQTSNNQKKVDFFLKKGSITNAYDFSPFMLTHRLKHFASLAFENKSALLFVFWENNKLYSICDFEFANKTDLAIFALRVKALRGKVFCLNAKQTKLIDQKNLTGISDYLLSLEQQQIDDITGMVSLFVAQLMLTDITEVFDNNAYFSLYINTKAGHVSTVNVWCENQKINLSTSKVIKELTLNKTNSPEKLELNVKKIRYKPRYVYAIAVHLSIHHKMFSAETVDFSQTGIGVKYQCDKKHIPHKGDYVLVSFTTFEKKVKDINFNDILHQITRVIYRNGYIELGLVRIQEKKNIEVADFFSQLINRNKSKLDICINDRIEYTLSYLMEAYIGNTINSIPLLISKDKINKQYIKHVGLTEIACNLAEHFFLKSRGYNFKLLTSEKRLDELYLRTIRSNNKKDLSIILFMYKDTDEKGVEFINSFTSLEIVYQGDLLNMLAKLFEKNGVCIKLNFINHLKTDPSEMNKISDMVASVNKLHANLFKKELSDDVGLIDMVDVTLAYKKIYELQQ